MQGGAGVGGGGGGLRITNAAFSRAWPDKVTEDVQTSRDGQEAGERRRGRI